MFVSNAQYNATPPTLADGQFGSLQLDANGKLITSGSGGGAGDASAANQTTQITAIGSLTETAPATDTASSGLNGRLQRIAQRLTSLIAAALTVVGNVASGATDSGNPVKVGGIYSATLPTLTDLQRGNAQLDANGNVRSRIVGNLVTGIDAVSNTVLSSTQTTSNTNDASVRPLISAGLVFNGTTWDRLRGDTTGLMVQHGAKTTSVTALETGGSGIIGWLSQIWRDLVGIATAIGTTAATAYSDATGAAAGSTNAILKGLYVKALDATGVAVTPIPRATANGATVSRVNSAASNNLTNLKASAGNIVGIDVFNVAAYTVFLKLYNKASAPVVASDTPVWTIPIPANSGFSREFTFGRSFATGIGYAIVKLQADTDATNVVALDLTGSIAWI